MTTALAIQRQRAEAVARAIVARLPDGAVRTVFAGGSLGRGEVWAAQVDGVLEIYSDVDLFVVLAEGAPRAAALAAVRAAVALPEKNGAPGVRFLREVDAGVYAPGDLIAQPVRPGTADLGYRHLLLHGDSAVLRDLGAAMSRPMARTEALYLLENRALELACAGPASSPELQRAGVVAALKARLDVGAAHLIAEGRYSTSASEREAQLATAPPATMGSAERAAVASAFAASRNLEAYLRGRDAGAETAEALRLIAASWRSLAASILGADAESPRLLLARRCATGRWTANAREVVRLRHAAGWGPGRALIAALRLARFAPRALLRTRAVAAEIGRSRADWQDATREHATHVERLTRALGFNDGDLTRRACAAHRALTRE